MITVKPIRQSDDAQPKRDDYQSDEPNKRRWAPIAFLLIVGGCAAYLKSFLPIRSEARGEQEAKRPVDDDQPDALAPDTIVAETDDVTGAIASSRKPGAGTTPVRFELRGDAPVTLLSPSLMKIDNAQLRDSSDDAASIGDPVQAGNDNRNDRDTSAKGSAGGGGGGGGGSGGSSTGGSSDNPAGGSSNPPNGNGGGSNNGPGGQGPSTPPDSSTQRNRAPRVSGPLYLSNVVGCETLTISVLALLQGASDPDGDALSITGLSASSGSLSRTDDGDWVFVRDQGMLGDVTLTYSISDGHASVQQTAYFSVVEAPPIIGTDGDDNLLGTRCGDVIDGRGGNDNIDAREGDDVINGGDGDDHIVAGSGHDIVSAGAGHDIVFAGPGNDIIYGGAGHDRLFGESGDDVLIGESGDDTLDGGFGNDILLAGAGDDALFGAAGNDTLDGSTGHDRLDGGDGNDRLDAGSGNDSLAGGSGDDVLLDGAGSDFAMAGSGHDHLIASADAADDVFDGGDGHDTLDYSQARMSIAVDLALGTAEGEDIGQDSLAAFEEVIGGSGDDDLRAGASPVTLHGGDGNDRLSDGAGSDTVLGDAGDDEVIAAMDDADDCYSGGAGDDTLDYSAATISVTIDLGSGTAEGAEIGRDILAEFEEIIGGSGDDRFVADSYSISFTGGDGDDTFEFDRPDDDHRPELVRKVTDFTVGDRIVAATYEIYTADPDAAAEAISDLFEDIYLADGNDHHPVRFRHGRHDDGEFTVIDVHDRPDNDQDFYSIQLSGHHHLQFTIAVH